MLKNNKNRLSAFKRRVRSLIPGVLKKKKCSVGVRAASPPPPPPNTIKPALEELPDAEALVVYIANATHQHCKSPISKLKDFEIGYQAYVLMQLCNRAFFQESIYQDLLGETIATVTATDVIAFDAFNTAANNTAANNTAANNTAANNTAANNTAANNTATINTAAIDTAAIDTAAFSQIDSTKTLPIIEPVSNCSFGKKLLFQQESSHQLLPDLSKNFMFYVLSPKGLFVYCSASTFNILEYYPEELLNLPLSTLCHPLDVVCLMRKIEVATANVDQTISLVFRVRRKYSGYMWLKCRGETYTDQSTGYKCLVLSGREHASCEFSGEKALGPSETTSAPKASNETSLNGSCSYVSLSSDSFVINALEEGTIYEYYEGDKNVTNITRALELIEEGQIVNSHCTMKSNRGVCAPMPTNYGPGEVYFSIARPSTTLVQDIAEISDTEATIGSPVEVFVNGNAIDEVVRVKYHQFRTVGRKLKEKLKNFTIPKLRKRKSNNMMATEEFNSPKVCANCPETDSFMWRAGPSGREELCNNCGLSFLCQNLGTKFKTSRFNCLENV